MHGKSQTKFARIFLRQISCIFQAYHLYYVTVVECLMNPLRKTVAVTIGDMNGIGPEVVLKALERWPLPPHLRVAIVGPAAALEFWQAHLRLSLALPAIADLEAWPEGAPVVVLDAEHLPARFKSAGFPSAPALSPATRSRRRSNWREQKNSCHRYRAGEQASAAPRRISFSAKPRCWPKVSRRRILP
jgi:hypothetical protein